MSLHPLDMGASVQVFDRWWAVARGLEGVRPW